MSWLLLAATHTHTQEPWCVESCPSWLFSHPPPFFSLSPPLPHSSPARHQSIQVAPASPFFFQMFSTLLYVVFIISFRSIWPEGNQNLALAIHVAHAPLFYSDDPLYSRSLFISNMMFPVNMSEKPPLIHHAYVSRQYRDTWLISFSFSAGGVIDPRRWNERGRTI